MINPAPETTPIGLSTDSQAVMVFAEPFIKLTLTRDLLPIFQDLSPRQLFRDVTPSAHLSGLAKTTPTVDNDDNQSYHLVITSY